MLAIRALLPTQAPYGTPVLLVHGAANSSLVWQFWQEALAERGYPSYALDLRGHGASVPFDLSGASMEDYAEDVCSVAGQLRGRLILLGWSMGGLVALMAAGGLRAAAWVGLEPSVPALAPGQPINRSSGVFGPEEYGITSDDLDDQPEMPELGREERRIALASLGLESRYARDQRKAGIAVQDVACPLLLVSGNPKYAHAGYGKFPLPHDFLVAEGLSHWGLVLNKIAVGRLAGAVVDWLAQRGL